MTQEEMTKAIEEMRRMAHKIVKEDSKLLDMLAKH